MQSSAPPVGQMRQAKLRKALSLPDLAERYEHLCLFCCCVLYALIASMRAMRPFWYDELITLNVASLPSFAAVLEAMGKGADLNPVLFYLLTWSSVQVLGPTEFALRLPGLCGFLVFCLSLRSFVRRRAGAGFGLAAFLFPLLSGAFYYSAEARAYGLVLGFSGLALLSWQRAVEVGGELGVERRWSLLGLGLALTAALLTHCYAVLTLVPYGLAQMERDIRARRVDAWQWFALVLPAFAVLSYLPLLGPATPYAFDSPVFRPSWQTLVDFWPWLLGSASWALLAALLLAVVLGPAEEKLLPQRPSGETTLAAGFLLLPVLAMLLAHYVTKIFMQRYGLTALLGFSVLFFPALARRVAAPRRLGAAVALLFFCSFVAMTADQIFRGMQDAPAARLSLEQQPELPLLVSSGLLFYPLQHYSGPEQVKRLHFITAPAYGRRWTGTDVFDRGYWDLHRLFPLRAQLSTYEVFLSRHKKFLMYGYANYELDWIPRQLLHEGATLRFLGQQRELMGQAALYEVTMPDTYGMMP